MSTPDKEIQLRPIDCLGINPSTSKTHIIFADWCNVVYLIGNEIVLYNFITREKMFFQRLILGMVTAFTSCLLEKKLLIALGIFTEAHHSYP